MFSQLFLRSCVRTQSPVLTVASIIYSEDMDAPLLGEPLPIELANTRFAHRGHEHDGLREPADLAGWLRAVRERLSVAPTEAELDATGDAELERARELRDALRTLLAASTDGRPLDRDGVATVNRAVRAAPHWIELGTGKAPASVRRSAAPGVDAALAGIAQEAVELLSGDRAADLRACGAPGCMLFFRKDHPRRAWCSPRCSDRVRAARQYARRRSASG
jgi:predicted RNA-binding Zn ribbon-like protein